MNLKIVMLENEHWWGSTIAQSEKMPFDRNTETIVNLADKRSTVQAAPYFCRIKEDTSGAKRVLSRISKTVRFFVRAKRKLS